MAVYYVIRVLPRQEQVYLKMAQKQLSGEDFELLLPRKKVEHRKLGKWKSVEVPLFPGYVFLETAERLGPELYRQFKQLAGFVHFLKEGDQLGELRGTDLTILKHFLSYGEVLQESRVTFDENQRIRVHSGPMEGLEGRVVSVDRRKRRAKIVLDFDNKQVHLTLGFEVLAESADKEDKGNP